MESDIFRKFLDTELIIGLSSEEIVLLENSFKDKKLPYMYDSLFFDKNNEEKYSTFLYELHKYNVTEAQVSWFRQKILGIEKEIYEAQQRAVPEKEEQIISNECVGFLEKYNKILKPIEIQFAIWLANGDISYEYISSRREWSERNDKHVLLLASKLKKSYDRGLNYYGAYSLEDFKKKSVRLSDFEIYVNAQINIDKFINSVDTGELDFYSKETGEKLTITYVITHEIVQYKINTKEKMIINVLVDIMEKYDLGSADILVEFMTDREILDEDEGDEYA